jgi:hypothetical protein
MPELCMKSIIFFETNEIPWRMVDDFIARFPHSALASLVEQSRNYETVSPDEIELDPWISWSTVHRGVNDKQHGILHLGQSLEKANAKYPPIWSLLHDAGKSVGVFGSLHSNAVPANARDYAFFVPDCFAAKSFAHPANLAPFQDFNLAMTRKSARNVDTGIPLKEALRFGAAAIKNGLTVQTVGLVAKQLAAERATPHRKIRRRSLQGIIGLDLFIDQLERTKPDFATYFTNHVAAAMHRYWAGHFTGDWGQDNPMGDEWVEKYKGECLHAMQILDVMLRRLMNFVERHEGYGLVMTSSLGQAKVDVGLTKGFTTLTNVAKFMAFIGLDSTDWCQTNAMVPWISLEINPERAAEVVDRISKLEIMGATPVRDEREVKPISFDLRDGNSLHLYFIFENQEPVGDVRIGNRSIPIEEAGFGFFVHEDNVACSAHHIAEGIMMLYDPASPVHHSATRERFATTDIAPALLRHFGVARPAYMRQSPALSLTREEVLEDA